MGFLNLPFVTRITHHAIYSILPGSSLMYITKRRGPRLIGLKPEVLNLEHPSVLNSLHIPLPFAFCNLGSLQTTLTSHQWHHMQLSFEPTGDADLSRRLLQKLRRFRQHRGSPRYSTWSSVSKAAFGRNKTNLSFGY